MTSKRASHPASQAAPHPRIVVLDGHTADPGDLGWGPLEALGDLTVYARTPTEVVERAAPAQVVVTNKVVLDERVLARLPETRLISVLATGTNVVDLAAARRRSITVCNVPGYGTPSVAQHVFALLFAITTRVEEHAAHVRGGGWAKSPDFCYTLGPIHEVAGRTLGIVGLGAIGTEVAAYGSALGMHVVAAEHQSSATRATSSTIERAPLDDVLRRADVLTLHCPLTDRTHHLIDAARLSLMKPTAILVNTARGLLVDERALAAALDAGRLAAAGLDVLSTEPPPEEHPLVGHPRCIITPHIAWASVESRQRLIRATADNVRAFLLGSPQNVVN